MLNQIILVGRLTRDITVNKSENGIKVATISIAVPRSFKNTEGLYDTDFIDCVAFDNIAENTSEYCSKGDIVGVKGRIQTRMIEKEEKGEDGKKIKKEEKVTEIICEKNAAIPRFCFMETASVSISFSAIRSYATLDFALGFCKETGVCCITACCSLSSCGILPKNSKGIVKYLATTAFNLLNKTCPSSSLETLLAIIFMAVVSA